MAEQNLAAEPKKEAFDLKALEEKLLAKGLPVAEGLAKAVAEGVFEWLEESVKASDSKIDDFALALFPPMKTWVLQKIEGISK